MKKATRIFPVFGALGFVGVLGFFFTPLFFSFFSFFGFWGWRLLCKKSVDERLEENIRKASGITSKLALVLCFLILVALDRELPSETILLWGSIGYSVAIITAPIIAYIVDKRG